MTTHGPGAGPEDDWTPADDEGRAARHMQRTAWSAQVPDHAWDKVHARVVSRRRRRRATAAGTSTLAAAAVLSVVLAGGLTGLSATSARLVGPAGYPDSNATTTLAPTDEKFAYYTHGETFDELLADGPDRETLDVLTHAEELLLRNCVQAAGAAYTPLDGRAAYEAGAEERLVRQRALQRRADAFGDPAVAAERGYGIDREEWMRVVVNGPTGGDTPAQVGVAEEDQERVGALLSGPLDDYMRIDLGAGSTVDVPGAGCLFEAQSELWGDYVQVTRSRDKVGNTMQPETLRMVASVHDPRLRAADVVWSSCMAGKGWRGLDDQTEAYALVWNDYWSAGRDNAAQIEREVAVADAECVQDTGYGETLAEAEARLVEHLTSDPDVIAYGALVEDALPRAIAVVQEEAERVEATQHPTQEEAAGMADAEADLARAQSQADYFGCMAERGYVLASQDEELQWFTGPDGAEVSLGGDGVDDPLIAAAQEECLST